MKEKKPLLVSSCSRHGFVVVPKALAISCLAVVLAPSGSCLSPPLGLVSLHCYYYDSWHLTAARPSPIVGLPQLGPAVVSQCLHDCSQCLGLS